MKGNIKVNLAKRRTVKIEIKMKDNMTVLTSEALAEEIWISALKESKNSKSCEELVVQYPKQIKLIATSVIDQHLRSIKTLHKENEFKEITILVASKYDKVDFESSLRKMFINEQIVSIIKIEVYGLSKKIHDTIGEL